MLVVDADHSALSRKLTVSLEGAQGLAIVGRPASLGEAFDQIREQQAEVLVYIPEDFSTRIKRGEQTALKVWVNTGNMYTYSVAYADLNQVVLDLDRHLGQDFLERRGLPPKSAAARVLPVAFVQRWLFAPTAGYGDFLVIGVLLLVVQQLVLLSLAYSLGWQHEDHEAAPPARLAYTELVGRSTVHLAFHVPGLTFIVLGICRVFGWPVQSQLAVWCLFVALAVTMVPPALLVAHLARDRYTGFQLLMFFSAPVLMMSGFSWPPAAMGEVIRAVSWIFPATPALQALRVLSVKSGDAAVLWPALKVLAVQTAAWSIFTWGVIRIGAVRRARNTPALEGASTP